MQPRPDLERPRASVATGVSAGLAAHLGWQVGLVRLAFVVLSLTGGFGVLLYCWLWAFMPRASGTEVPTRRAPVAWLLLAASAFVLVAAAATGDAARLAEQGALGSWFVTLGAGIALAVAAGAWGTFIDRVDPERGPRGELTVRVVATSLLVITALVLLSSPTASLAPMLVFAAALLAVLGIALVFAPLLVAQWRALSDERTRRIRDEERNEIAAHLHDSVLQTLALIQNRAGATSEVGRIARAQERELREWLFAGDAAPDRDLGAELRDYAAALEIDHAVTFDVVVVGESDERASGELAAAAREAMLNAARHAGGEVTVYVEASPTAVEVFVRDRGPGFDMAQVPSDRLGVRQSLIGRMRRAGGEVTIRRSSGGVGTEVRIHYPIVVVPTAAGTGGAPAAPGVAADPVPSTVLPAQPTGAPNDRA